MLTYLLFFLFFLRTSAVLVNSSLIPHLESLTPPSPKHTIFGSHYNSSPLAQTHSLTDTHPWTHTHRCRPTDLFYGIALDPVRARSVFTEQPVSRSVGHTRTTSTALPVLSFAFLWKNGHAWTMLCASMFSGCLVPKML